MKILSKTTISFFSWLVVAGCYDGAPDAERPLRPLVYTEQPNQTSEMVEAREARLLRELDAKRSPTEAPDPIAPKSAEELGRAIIDSLTRRDIAAFESLWHTPETIAISYGIPLQIAQDRLDQNRGDSKATWDQFDGGRPSERRANGFGDVVTFQSLQLGEKVDDRFTGNSLLVNLNDSSIVLSFPIAEIVERAKVFKLASSVAPSDTLDFIRTLGLHLRPSVMAPDAYWFPLSVGNFWRYRLSDREVTRDLGRFERGLEDSDGATVRTVQVVSVDRVRTRRVVTLKIAYDDEDETTVFERWLLFPRAIYMCDSNCFALFDDLAKLLEYVQQEEPLFRLPLRPGERWGDITVVGVEDVTVPMGKFDGVLDLQLSARAGQFDPALFYPQRLFLKPGVGIIKRNVERSSRPIEALIEYRLMH